MFPPLSLPFWKWNSRKGLAEKIKSKGEGNFLSFYVYNYFILCKKNHPEKMFGYALKKIKLKNGVTRCFPNLARLLAGFQLR